MSHPLNLLARIKGSSCKLSYSLCINHIMLDMDVIVVLVVGFAVALDTQWVSLCYIKEHEVAVVKELDYRMIQHVRVTP